MKKFMMTFAAISLLAFPAFAQSECTPFTLFEEMLQQEYGEEVFLQLETPSPLSFVILINPETETFTVMSLENGCGAVVAVGQGINSAEEFNGESF